MRKISTCVLVALLGLATAFPQEDQVKQLPDCEPFGYGAYSGYLNVSETKALHYFFVESQDKPDSDPLMVWFNGGPGCSSLLGMF